MKSWRLLDHPADLFIEGTGDTREEALEALILGLISELHEGGVEGRETRTLAYTGEDRLRTTVGFLGELLYLAQQKLWLPAMCKVSEAQDDAIRAECAGEPYDPGRHRLAEIKAATFHDFLFEPQAQGGFIVRVLFDV